MCTLWNKRQCRLGEKTLRKNEIEKRMKEREKLKMIGLTNPVVRVEWEDGCRETSEEKMIKLEKNKIKKRIIIRIIWI